MSQKQDKFNKRRLKSSYLSVIVSMTLVLFLIGLLGTVLYHSNSIANKVQENIAFTVLLKPEAKQVSVNQFQRQLELSEHVKSTEFISKEEAANLLKEDLGEDFVSFLGFNPLTDAIDIHFQAYYTQTNTPEKIEAELLAVSVVQEVVYDKSLLNLLNKNLKKVSYILLLLSLVFSLIAVALINSSIRLTIYSKRFLIKTMQLVGATKSFIRKPFLWKSIQHGLIASLLSIFFLHFLISYSVNFLPEIQRILVHVVFYVALMTVGSMVFAKFWIDTTNMGTKDVAKQIERTGMQIPGFRKNPKILEKILENYIPPVTYFSGAFVGLLAAGADLLGTVGNASGTGLLLAVGIILRTYEQIQKEQAMEMHPMIRQFFGAD